MGDRALIIFTDGNEVSPICYLHWSGAVVPEMLEAHKQLMLSRGADVAYAYARFVGIAHVRHPDSNLSLGGWNMPKALERCVIKGDAAALAKASHGDAGFVVVDVRGYSWKAYGGYLTEGGTN